MKKEKLSVRLTNDMKDKILSKILSNAFDKEAEKLENRRFELSEKVYNDYYDKVTRDKINSLPEGWLPKKNRMYVVFGNSQTGYCERNFKEEKRFLSRDTEHRALKVYPYEHKLTIVHDELTREIETFKERKRKAHNEARAVVNSANTTGQLKEIWPSIKTTVEEFEPSKSDGKTGTEIAPILADLNKSLGLK